MMQNRAKVKAARAGFLALAATGRLERRDGPKAIHFPDHPQARPGAETGAILAGALVVGDAMALAQNDSASRAGGAGDRDWRSQ